MLSIYNELKRLINFDLPAAPELSDLKNALAIAQKMVRLPITVSWPVGKDRRILIIICGLEAAPNDDVQWVLREQERADAPVMWKRLTNDCSLIHELILDEQQVRDTSNSAVQASLSVSTANSPACRESTDSSAASASMNRPTKTPGDSQTCRTDLYNQLRKRTNFDLPAAPTLADLTNAFAIAQRMGQLPITVSWPVGNHRRTLLIICGLESTATDLAQWVLREQEKADAPVLWKQRTNDCRIIHRLVLGEKQTRDRLQAIGQASIPRHRGRADFPLTATADLPVYEDGQDPLSDPLVTTGEAPVYDQQMHNNL
jgi:hypothetical protein